MAALFPEERSENARRAARIRWAKGKQASGTSAKNNDPGPYPRRRSVYACTHNKKGREHVNALPRTVVGVPHYISSRGPYELQDDLA